MPTAIGIIGAGSMGETLLSGLLEANLFPPDRIFVSDVNEDRQSELETEYKVHTTDDNKALASQVDYVILAVKPKVVDKVMQEIGEELEPGQKLFSIAAGVSTGQLEQYLASGVPVIRLMPNTPALVKKGAIAYCLGTAAESSDAELVEKLFSPIGIIEPVEEKLMDTVTGLSGSGPAYIYVLIEALADAGVYEGLDRETALKLATQTVSGAAEMVTQLEEHPGKLKDMVASPGGTTITGLKKLEESGFRASIYQAVAAAVDKSSQLGGE